MTQPVIFVSYSRKDEKDKDKLLSHLGVLQREELTDLWSDDRIGAGADWKQEIREAMVPAKVAILLISANFLTSDFILNEEVPTLLQRRKSEGLIVFPVIARSCAWQQVDWLTQMNVRPKNGRPVWGWGRDRVDKELAAIAEEVAAIVKTGSSTSSTAREVNEKSKNTYMVGPQFPKKWPPEVPERVTGILKRDLVEDPTERFSSAGELTAALDTPAEFAPVSESGTKRGPSRFWIGGVVALGIVCTALFAALYAGGLGGYGNGAMAVIITPTEEKAKLETMEPTEMVEVDTEATLTAVGRATAPALAADTQVTVAVQGTRLTELQATQTAEAPTPTSTPTRTPRPTPTPTATIDTDPTMYDNFNNPAYDGSFNQNLWINWDDPTNQQVAQQNGVLILTRQEGKPNSGIFVSPTKYSSFTLDIPTFFEAEIMIDSSKPPESHHGLGLDTGLPARGEAGQFTDCGMQGDGLQQQAWLSCSNYIGKAKYSDGYFSEGKLVSYGTWHIVRIEVNPATMMFTYYIDGQMVGSYIPDTVEELKKAKFTPNVGVSGLTSDQFSGYVDDVRIGPIGQ